MIVYTLQEARVYARTWPRSPSRRRRVFALDAASGSFHSRATPLTCQGGSMARIPLVTREQIVEKEKPAYDAFMLSRANRPNIGPYSLLLHMPEMAQRLEALRIYLRDEASLPPKLQELVMISVAREMSCAFIWYAHAATARFGQRGTMALTNLIACYAVLAYNMNTYDLEAPAHPTEKALL